MSEFEPELKIPAKDADLSLITREIFLSTLECSTRGWLLRSGKLVSSQESLSRRYQLQEEGDLRARARALFPGGVCIDDSDLLSAAEQTRSNLENSRPATFHRAVAIHNNYVAVADILVREKGGEGFHLLEVRNSCECRAKHIDEMAYTAMVFNRCGFPVQEVSLLLLNEEFRLGMSESELFLQTDQTGETLSRAADFQMYLNLVDGVSAASEIPKAELRLDCSQCSLLQECFCEQAAEGISPSQNQEFADTFDISDEVVLDISDSLSATAERRRHPIAGDVETAMKRIEWPVYYLYFETVTTAVPLYDGVSPNESLPVQYSIHRCSDYGVIDGHFSYLADPQHDCRQEFAERLLADLNNKGSVLVFSSLERRIFSYLARYRPDLTVELKAASNRIFDFEAVIPKRYTYMELGGSAAVKRILAVLLPDISENVLVDNKNDTAAAFTAMARGKYTDTEKVSLKKALLEYGRQDSLAMVWLHKRLAKIYL